mgnify:FL=1
MSQKVDLQVLAGDYVKKAYISEWKVQVGDEVKKGDVLLCCETGKVTVDIESPCDGIIEKILYPAGEEVDISEAVAVIGDGSGAATAAPVPAAPAAMPLTTGESTNVDLQILAGDYVKKAYISEWKVQVGDKVKAGDVLLCCETGKVTVDVTSPRDGVVEQIRYPAGEEVDISEVVAVIGDGSGMSAAASPAAPAPVAAAAAPATSTNVPARVAVSPVAMKLAKELGVDVEAMKAALGKARIAKEDVLSYVESLKAAPTPKAEPTPSAPAAEAAAPATQAAVNEIPVRGRRRAIAQKMSESTSTKPRVTHMMDVDLEEMYKVKQALSQRYPDQRFTMTGLLAVAVCKALKAFPCINATYENDVIREHAEIRLGIAVDMPEGLIVPVIHGCDAMSGKDICQAVNKIAGDCRDNKLPPSAYMGGTFTISNLGSEGVRYLTPIINAPEVAILGVGSMRKELALVNGQIEQHRVMGLCLSFDHRAVDGAPAARFLRTLRDYMENPFLLSF